MSAAFIAITVLSGIAILVFDCLTCYGAVSIWDEQKTLSLIFFIAVIAITAAYIYTVIRIFCEK